jgi:hypothetical protein
MPSCSAKPNSKSGIEPIGSLPMLLKPLSTSGTFGNA